MAHIFIPAQLRDLTAGQIDLQLNVNNLEELMVQLEKKFPGIRERLCEGEHLRSSIAVSIDGVLSSRGMLAKIPPNSEVHFLPAIGGG